jgi:hypothetical protein
LVDYRFIFRLAEPFFIARFSFENSENTAHDIIIEFFQRTTNTMGSPDSVPESALLDQDEVPAGKALELGSRYYDKDDDDDDCSCRTDRTTVRASNVVRKSYELWLLSPAGGL